MITVNSFDELQALIAGGFDEWGLLGDVGVTKHEDLMIFNYARIHSMNWNWFECQSRGLILQQGTGKIVARPFEKFFNWLEKGRRCAKDAHLVTTTEKLDGSIGIIYYHKGKWNVASRGSFDGPHAQWGQNWIDKWGLFTWLGEGWRDWTFIVEMIWPENKIVIDYGSAQGMHLLGVRHTETGRYLPRYAEGEASLVSVSSAVNMGLPKPFNFNGVLAVLEARESLGANEEGYVCEFSDGTRFKFKGDRYKEMHRLVTGSSYKHIIRMMQLGVEIPSGYAISERAAFVRQHVEDIKYQVEEAFRVAPKESRKEYALFIKEHYLPLMPYMFARLDDQDYEPIIYRQAFK